MHETKLLKLDISKSKENLIGSQLFLLIKVNYTSEWYEKKLKGIMNMKFHWNK